ncbi:MAG: bifunctional diguanylate cyclase/phosphodiesterase [Actinomycetota bacterium]
MTDSDLPTAHQRPSGPWSTPRVRVAFLTAAIAGTAALIVAVHPDAFTASQRHLPIGIAIVAGFALSEKLIFHVEARNEAVSYTPTELALAVGLVFLNPAELVASRLIGATIGVAIWRRMPLFKLAFNLANFAFETAVAVLVFWLLGGESVLTSWLGIFAGLSLAMTTGGVLVTAAVAQFEGGFLARAKEQLDNASIFYIPPAAIGAAIAVPMTVDPWLGVPAAVSAPVLWYIVSSHGALLHRYSDLADVHDFSRVVGDAHNVHQLAERAAERLAAASRAEHVAVRLWIDDEPIDAAVGLAHADLPDLMPDDHNPAWQALLEQRDIAPLGPEEAESVDLADVFGQPLIAPLADDRGVLGIVIIADRAGASSTFTDDDIERLRAMIQQLTVAVRKAQFNAQIQYEATHDRLTGLANRAFFEAWLAEAIREGRTGAVLLLDLDRFKQVNDAFGHHAGDQLLVGVGDRIADVCADADLAARFGGDEYAIFLDGLNGRTALRFADELARSLTEPITAGPAEVVTTASVGISVMSDIPTDPAELLRRADLAMYSSKRTNTAPTVYDTTLENDDSSRLMLLADLRTAIAHDALEVYFQPQIDITTGQISGAEALVRWIHPEHGFVNPEEFVHLAEQAGLINDLTRSVLRIATAAAQGWHRRGWNIDLSVNISAVSLQDELLEPLVAEELRRSGLDPNRLCLEITETTMMGDPVRTHRILHRLEAFGVRFSVDDFGTGHSSLVNLRNLPVDELKVDRSFVMRMLDEQHDDVIVRSTIDLGHNLGLKVVAEGVENDAILRRLGELGCDIAQGYHISRPMPPADFTAFVAEHQPGGHDWEAPDLRGSWVHPIPPRLDAETR